MNFAFRRLSDGARVRIVTELCFYGNKGPYLVIDPEGPEQPFMLTNAEFSQGYVAEEDYKKPHLTDATPKG